MHINSEYIFAVIYHGSFSRAAEALFIAQPALSRYIIKLEKDLGIKIFDRGKLPIKLTSAGKELVEYLNKSKKLEKNFYLKITALKENERQQIKLGIVPWRIPLFLPNIIPKITQEFPYIDVAVSEDVSPNLEDATIRGELDLCVVNGPSNSTQLEYIQLSRECVELLAPAGSAFVQKNSGTRLGLDSDVSWEDETFILLRKDFRLGRIARAIFQYYGKSPNKIIEVWNMNSAISMVCAGMGLTFIPASGMPRHLPADKRPVSFQIIEGNFTFPLLLAYKKGSYENNSIRMLINFISNCYRTLDLVEAKEYNN